MFRYKPTVYLPKPGSKDIYQRLLKQVENLKIPVIKSTDELKKSLKEQDVIMDAVFGASLPLRFLVKSMANQASRFTPPSEHRSTKSSA